MKKIILLLIFAFALAPPGQCHHRHRHRHYQRIVYNISKLDTCKFNVDSCRKAIYQNCKFPDIAWRQARLESGNFRSRIFRHSNNIFGMRHNKRGYSTGKWHRYAVYSNWSQSIKDFAKFQSKFHSRKSFIHYLCNHYAADRHYYRKLLKFKINSYEKDTQRFMVGASIFHLGTYDNFSLHFATNYQNPFPFFT